MTGDNRPATIQQTEKTGGVRSNLLLGHKAFVTPTKLRKPRQSGSYRQRFEDGFSRTSVYGRNGGDAPTQEGIAAPSTRVDLSMCALGFWRE